MCEGLAGQTALQTRRRRRDPAAELRASLEGQESLEEAESGGSLRGALQKPQRGHGEQDFAAAAQDKRAGESAPQSLGLSESDTSVLRNIVIILLWEKSSDHWELSYHMHSMCVSTLPPAAQGKQRAQ